MAGKQTPRTISAGGALISAAPATMRTTPVARSANRLRDLNRDNARPLVFIPGSRRRLMPHHAVDNAHDPYDAIDLALRGGFVGLQVPGWVLLHRHVIGHPAQDRVASVVNLVTEQ